MVKRAVEWFCTKCKQKFETDDPDPDCPHCNSKWVSKNRPEG